MRLSNLMLRNDTLVAFKAGEAIFKEGDIGDSMFVLFEGVADVFVGDKLIGTFEPVEIFGEMAVIDPGPRSATIVAKTDCKLAAVGPKRFILLLSQPEFALHILKMLIERIRWMNETARNHATSDRELISELKLRIEQLTEINRSQADEISRIESLFEVARPMELTCVAIRQHFGIEFPIDLTYPSVNQR